MNVYIWEGTNRDDATKQIVSGNKQPILGTTYSVSGSSGILIVAYPNEDVEDTELGFEYWTKEVV